MADINYEDFDVFVYGRADGKYGARVTFPDGSVANETFDFPYTAEEIAGFHARARTVRGAAEAEGGAGEAPALQMDVVRDFGQRLYAALITGGIRDHYKALYAQSVGKNSGIRLRLELAEAPDLLVLPWELLFDEDAYQFLALTEKIAVVRSLGVSVPLRPLDVTSPLRVLVVAPQPRGTEALKVQEEWRNLQAAMAGLQEDGKVVLEPVEPPTLRSLRERLTSLTSYQIVHFIGHGEFDAEEEESYLALEDEKGDLDPVDGQLLATLLHSHESLRLVVLNACQGGETSPSHPFAGLAQSLVRQEVPAVLAMQSVISDDSAVEFSESFYRAVGLGRPVEAAVWAGRMAVRSHVDLLEWSTPVLYTRLKDGMLFQISEVSPEDRRLLQDKTTLAELWTPRGLADNEATIALVYGVWDEALADHGEFEPVVALPYALMMGELRQLLQVLYANVTLARGEPPEGHEGPVVYVGGPVTVPAVARVVEQCEAPFWFLGLPYDAGGARSIGKPGVAYAPELDGRRMISDVGVAIRITEGGRLSFVVAGCYGVGTLGAARFLMDPEQVRALGDLVAADRMSVVVRSVAAGWDVAKTELVTETSW
jgi:CHAT domain